MARISERIEAVYSGQNVDTSCEEIENAMKGEANKIIPKKEKKMEIQKEQKCGGTECEEAIKIYYKA